jgi:two-component system, OmpR family, KDP operon response regulator KdpE
MKRMDWRQVLVVDDDSQIVRAIETSLRARGFNVAIASNGETALERVAHSSFGLMILDLGLPGIDGQEVIKRLRSWSDIPVIVLSVREAQDEKIAALDAGADDYVVKPFAMGELLARMRSVRRRSSGDDAPSIMRFGDLEIDLGRRLVRLQGKAVHLTPTEYDLLRVLATNPGKLLTHTMLLQTVWGPGYGTESQYLRVFVRQLRRKLGDDPGAARFIITEPGLGYRWKAEPDPE